jgi:Na+/melibiose symporter-like transporter
LLGHFSFGSVFLVNVPFVLAALLLGIVLVPRSRDPEEADLDLVGAGLSIVGISSLVYGLIEAPDKGWLGGSTLVAFGIGIVVMTAFVLWERQAEEPMLDMAFFRNPAFSTGTGGMILVFLAMFGVMFLITQYFQLVLGYSPLGAAVRFLPISPIMVIVAPLTPRITARIGSNRTVCMGMLLTGVGFAGFWFLTTHTPYSYVLLCIALLVGGIALTMSPMTAAIMSAVPPRRAGAGSAMNDATRELGSALGVAVLGSIAASRYGSGIGAALHPLSRADQVLARTSLGTALQAAEHLPARLGGPLVTAAQRSFVSGIHVAALAGSALCVIAALAVLRNLPHTILQHGAVEAVEDTAVLALAGGEPLHPSDRGFTDGATDADEPGDPTPELTATD